MRQHRLTRSAPLAAAVAALAAPTAAAQQDLRNPDTRDAAPASAVQQDLRSPDARDAADGRGDFNAPQVTVVKLPAPSTTTRGIDWSDAGMGAAGALVLAGSGALAMLYRRRDSAAHAPTVISS